MRRTRGRTVEVASLADLDRRLARGRDLAARLAPARARPARARRRRWPGSTSSGRSSSAATLGDPGGLEARGAVVLPRPPGVPGRDRPRHALHRPRALRHARATPTPSTPASTPGRSSRVDREASLARALHDHAVDDALEAWVRDRRLVGVMGGHALVRGSEEYADAARLGRALGSTHVVATGGGPGAMEAANLGRAHRAAPPPTCSTDALDDAGARAVVPPRRRGLGRRGVRGGRHGRRPGEHAGHPDLALRPRAVQRVRDRDREVLPQRHPRGDPAGGLRRGHRLPARRGRHRAGGVPGRLRELLRRRLGGGADGARGPGALDRALPRVAAAAPHSREGRAMAPHVHLADSLEEAAEIVSIAG